MRLGYQHHSAVSDSVAPTELSYHAKIIVDVMSNDAFVTQRSIAERFAIDKQSHLAAIAEIRASDWAQQQILHSGVGTKYWTNTIAPLLASGTLQSAINHHWAYPNRVGLYTGLSCMFYCGFCGRNPVAKYDTDYAQIGRDFFFQIIDQDPKDDAMWQDRFRISGGLEPLTNPYLGEIISYGAGRGFKMQLYTNGNMMTDAYLHKHPGMRDLEAVRFSLYGTTADKAFAVTKNRQSFDHVIKNIIGYINAAPDVKVGLNYIILPGHSQDVLELLKVIEHINRTATRPIDFVTLREDFSQNIRVLGAEEREKLMGMFAQVNEFQRQWPTHFDFGYALEPLRYGRDVGQLRMIDWQDLVPEGFPQVSVAVDVKGDVYMYHETGFLDRPGADRYIIGNVQDSSVACVTQQWVNQHRTVKPMPMDVGFLDAFDHVVSILINQARDDLDFGIPWSQGPVVSRS
jgi:dTDP-4-amino-4,6-dideoxy-D-glucose ammonia-lyase